MEKEKQRTAQDRPAAGDTCAGTDSQRPGRPRSGSRAICANPERGTRRSPVGKPDHGECVKKIARASPRPARGTSRMVKARQTLTTGANRDPADPAALSSMSARPGGAGRERGESPRGMRMAVDSVCRGSQGEQPAAPEGTYPRSGRGWAAGQRAFRSRGSAGPLERRHMKERESAGNRKKKTEEKKKGGLAERRECPRWAARKRKIGEACGDGSDGKKHPGAPAAAAPTARSVPDPAARAAPAARERDGDQ